MTKSWHLWQDIGDISSSQIFLYYSVSASATFRSQKSHRKSPTRSPETDIGMPLGLPPKDDSWVFHPQFIWNLIGSRVDNTETKKKWLMRHFCVPNIVHASFFFGSIQRVKNARQVSFRQSNLCWFVGQMSPSKTSKSPTSTGLKTMNQLLQQSVPSFYQKELFFTQTSSPKLKSWLLLVRFADFADLIHIDSNWLFWQRVVFAFLFWMILFS